MGIYFAKTRHSDLVKIGYTKGEPEERIKKFQTGCPETLEIIHFEDGEYKDETRLHRMFSSTHYRGEWFTLKPDIDEYVKERKIAYEYWIKAMKHRAWAREWDKFEEQQYEAHLQKLEDDYDREYMREYEAWKKEQEKECLAETE